MWGRYIRIEPGTAILEQGAGSGMGHASYRRIGDHSDEWAAVFPLAPEGELDEHLSSQEKSSTAAISSEEAAPAPPAEVGESGIATREETESQRCRGRQ